MDYFLAVDREHYSSKGVHFEFHVSKVHLYICRVIFISLLLYSDLQKLWKKWLIFHGSNSCFNDTDVVKNKIKNKRKKIRRFAMPRFDLGTLSPCATEDVTTRPRSSKGLCEEFLYYLKQHWRHHYCKYFQSDLTLEIWSKKPFEEKVSDRPHYDNNIAQREFHTLPNRRNKLRKLKKRVFVLA